MAFTYQDIRETLEEREIEVQDYYFDRALKTLGYSDFPYSGLSDKGMNVLIGRAIELQKDETNLTSKKELVKHLGKKRGLEEKLKDKISKEDIKDIMKYVVNIPYGIVKGITYGTLGTIVAIPTMLRKWRNEDDWNEGGNDWLPLKWGIFESIVLYTTLGLTNPKLIIPVAATQAVTNIISGIYEKKRDLKDKAACLNCSDYSNYSPQKYHILCKLPPCEHRYHKVGKMCNRDFRTPL